MGNYQSIDSAMGGIAQPEEIEGVELETNSPSGVGSESEPANLARSEVEDTSIGTGNASWSTDLRSMTVVPHAPHGLLTHNHGGQDMQPELEKDREGLQSIQGQVQAQARAQGQLQGEMAYQQYMNEMLEPHNQQQRQQQAKAGRLWSKEDTPDHGQQMPNASFTRQAHQGYQEIPQGIPQSRMHDQHVGLQYQEHGLRETRGQGQKEQNEMIQQDQMTSIAFSDASSVQKPTQRHVKQQAKDHQQPGQWNNTVITSNSHRLQQYQTPGDATISQRSSDQNELRNHSTSLTQQVYQQHKQQIMRSSDDPSDGAISMLSTPNMQLSQQSLEQSNALFVSQGNKDVPSRLIETAIKNSRQQQSISSLKTVPRLLHHERQQISLTAAMLGLPREALIELDPQPLQLQQHLRAEDSPRPLLKQPKKRALSSKAQEKQRGPRSQQPPAAQDNSTVDHPYEQHLSKAEELELHRSFVQAQFHLLPQLSAQLTQLQAQRVRASLWQTSNFAVVSSEQWHNTPSQPADFTLPSQPLQTRPPVPAVQDSSHSLRPAITAQTTWSRPPTPALDEPTPNRPTITAVEEQLAYEGLAYAEPRLSKALKNKRSLEEQLKMLDRASFSEINRLESEAKMMKKKPSPFIRDFIEFNQSLHAGGYGYGIPLNLADQDSEGEEVSGADDIIESVIRESHASFSGDGMNAQERGVRQVVEDESAYRNAENEEYNPQKRKKRGPGRPRVRPVPILEAGRS